jgi:hypothetical protein
VISATILLGGGCQPASNAEQDSCRNHDASDQRSGMAQRRDSVLRFRI